MLPDFLRFDLDLVFVGYNASLTSADRGHYYAGRSNCFWTLLREVQLVPPEFGCDQDFQLPSLGIGMTDLVKIPSGAASEISDEDFRQGAQQVRRKLQHVQPFSVCCVGRGVYEWLEDRRMQQWGRQPSATFCSNLFVMPSTSGRANGLAETRRSVLRAVSELIRLHRLECAAQ